MAPGEARALVGEYGGNISAAARRAGLPRTTFRDLLRRAEAQKLPMSPSP
jgi:hypothetical protein